MLLVDEVPRAPPDGDDDDPADAGGAERRARERSIRANRRRKFVDVLTGDTLEIGARRRRRMRGRVLIAPSDAAQARVGGDPARPPPRRLAAPPRARPARTSPSAAHSTRTGLHAAPARAARADARAQARRVRVAGRARVRARARGARRAAVAPDRDRRAADAAGRPAVDARRDAARAWRARAAYGRGG
jgi:hypothetical protein